MYYNNVGYVPENFIRLFHCDVSYSYIGYHYFTPIAKEKKPPRGGNNTDS